MEGAGVALVNMRIGWRRIRKHEYEKSVDG